MTADPELPEEPSPDPEEEAAEAPAPRRGCRGALLALGALLVIAAAVVAFGWAPFVRWMTLREATRHGVELTLGHVEATWGSVEIRDCRFRLAGVAGLEGSCRRLTVSLDGVVPLRIEASGVDLALVGSATDLGLELAAYAKDHPELFRLPALAEDVDARWRPDPDEEPWLVIEGARVEPQGDGAALEATSVALRGFDVGRVGAVWNGDDVVVRFGFGAKDLAEAPVELVVEHARAQPKATFTLRKTRVDRLAGAFAVVLPDRDITAEGRVEVTFAAPGEPITGKLQARFEGYRPPVPPEVQGIVFGDATEVKTDLSLTPDYRRLTLKPLAVEHGAFALTGEGSMVREADYSVVAMALRGSLSCAALAAAAAQIRVGGVVGSWLGQLAGKTVTGSVGVTVTLRADSRKLNDAAFQQQIGVGCGLRPERILPGMLSELPGKLPALPSLLPDLR
ncbi:MAG: hypothetical protein R3B72_16015 [Polyangiaceae bacterium]